MFDKTENPMTTKPTYTPALRFPDFLNNGEWEVKRFDESFSFLPNNTLSRAELNYEKGNTKNIHYGDVLIKFGERLDVKKEELPFITDEATTNKFHKAKLQNGDVVIADTAEDDAVGKCTEIVGMTDETVVSGLHTIPIRPQVPFAESFLGYYLNSESYRSQLRPLMQGVKVTSLSKSAINKTTILCPKSVEEQKKIAQALTALDELIAATNERLEQMKAYKKGLMQKLFPAKGKKLPELRFKEFEKDGEWEVKKLGDIFSLIRNGAMYNTNNTSGFPMSRIETISNGVIDYDRVGYSETELKDYRLNEGDILFSHINSLAHIGKVAYYDGSKVLYHGMNLLVLRCEMSFYPLYIFYLLNTEEMKIALRSIAKRAINQASISTKELAQLLVYIPQKEEQRKIADCFTSIDEMINQYTNKVSFLEVYKKGLMQQMFPHVETQNFASLPTDKQM